MYYALYIIVGNLLKYPVHTVIQRAKQLDKFVSNLPQIKPHGLVDLHE